MASVRGGADQSAGGHDSVWPGRASARLERERRGGRSGESQQDGLHRQQHSHALVVGPVDAPSTAGTQYVTATAGGSPSGIADIVCSIDGGPAQTYPGASAQVPVSGIGPHSVSCYAQDNAVDPSGGHGTSTTSTWSLKIGQPTVVGIAFDKLVGLRCHRARVRVKVPGHWITVRRHGKRVKVKTRPHTKVERVMRCHPRTERRRTVVFVRERRHGHVVKVKRIKIVRVVVPPHVIAKTSRLVAVWPRDHRQRVSRHRHRHRDRRSRRERVDRAGQRAATSSPRPQW